LKIIEYLLTPFSYIYHFVICLRNMLYEKGYFNEISFAIPIIGVGNLTVGGTGKSPMVEYLIELVRSHDIQVATLSRGYKRKTKGFRIAKNEDTADTLGDEPFQFFNKYKDEITVSVGEDRAFSIPQLLSQVDADTILLDDAFQHRAIKPDLNILMTTYQRPFMWDRLLPAGRLREYKQAASRADVVIFSKCPNPISAYEAERLKKSVKPYANDAEVFFTSILYDDPKPLFQRIEKDISDIRVVTGIANPDPFIGFLSSKFRIVHHLRYSDHYRYSLYDIKKLIYIYNQNSKGKSMSIVTTEKDSVKWLPFRDELMSMPVYFIPIKTHFLKDEDVFKQIILSSIQKN